jgi:hypothetical protein
MDKLKGLEGGCLGEKDTKSGTSEQDDRVDRVMAVSKGNTAKYCVLKVLNTRGQYLELGKNICLGQAKPLR